MQLEPLAPPEQRAVLEHVEGLRVQRPVGALAGPVRAARHLHEAVVEGEVVPQRVLPALRVAPVVREAVRDEPVDLRQRQHALRGAPDRHRRQGYVGEGWLLITVGLTCRPRHLFAQYCSVMSSLSPPKEKLGQHVSHSGVEDKDWVSERDCAREAGVAAREAPPCRAAANREPLSLFVVFVGSGPVTEEFKLLSRLHYTKFIRHRQQLELVSKLQ